MNNYQAHQNLVKQFKLLAPKHIPGLRIFDRHVGMFMTRAGNPIRINKPGMADLYGLYGTGSIMIHIEIEAKTGKGVQSSSQKKWQKFIESNNGKYFLMRNAMETIFDIKEYLKDRLQNVYKELQ